MTIEELILGFQEGMLENFDILYKELKDDNNRLFNLFRKQMPSIFTAHDINAMLDDSLLDAVSSWSPDFGAKFTTYWCSVARNKKSNMIRSIFQKRNTFAYHTVETGAHVKEIDLNDAEGMFCLMAHGGMWELQDSQVFNDVMRFYCSSQKNAHKATYILLDAFCDYPTAEQKYAEICRVMKCTYSDATIRKRISRAKRDLKVFLEKV